MNITDLIAKLEAEKEKHGDVPVQIYDEWDLFPIEEVRFEKGEIKFFRQEPDHLAIYTTIRKQY